MPAKDRTVRRPCASSAETVALVVVVDMSVQPPCGSATGWDGGYVREVGRRLVRDRLLADAQGDRGVRGEGEHRVGSVVGQGATVPANEPERGRGANLVG